MHGEFVIIFLVLSILYALLPLFIFVRLGRIARELEKLNLKE